MGKVALSLFAVAALAGPAFAQGSVQLRTYGDGSSYKPWAHKLFEGEVTSHDFGTVPRGQQLKYEFHMTNIYGVPMAITDLRPSCGCLTFTVPKRVLQPKETGVIQVNMDAARFSGPKSVTLDVPVGPEYVDTTRLTLTANARSDVVFNPGEVNFGLVQRGQTPTKVLDVEYAGNFDWRIDEVNPPRGAPFNLKVNELARPAGITGYRFLVTLKPDPPPGPFHTQLLLKTNDPQSPVLTVSVDGNIQAKLTAAPDIVNLGTVKAGEAQTKKVMIRGDRAFRIVAIQGQGDGITADLPDRSAPFHSLTLRCQPSRLGALRKELLIRTDLDQEAVAVIVEANVAP